MESEHGAGSRLLFGSNAFAMVVSSDQSVSDGYSISVIMPVSYPFLSFLIDIGFSARLWCARLYAGNHPKGVMPFIVCSDPIKY